MALFQVIAPLVILANTLPFTPGGVGVAEGASAGLYAMVGVAGGANGMLLTRFFIVFHALVGFPFFLTYKRNNKRQHGKFLMCRQKKQVNLENKN